jgi:hypothetical protein
MNDKAIRIKDWTKLKDFDDNVVKSFDGMYVITKKLSYMPLSFTNAVVQKGSDNVENYKHKLILVHCENEFNKRSFEKIKKASTELSKQIESSTKKSKNKHGTAFNKLVNAYELDKLRKLDDKSV